MFSRDQKSWPVRFHCPLPGCKYHMLCDKTSSSSSFSSLPLLRQHYRKVHVNNGNSSIHSKTSGEENERPKGDDDAFACRHCNVSAIKLLLRKYFILAVVYYTDR